MTDKIISNIDAFAAFKTAPHIDVKDTYRRSASMLADAISQNIRPQVVWSPIPVLVSGEMSSTFVEPCKSIYKELELYNQQNDIIDCNLMVGYVWADTPRASASSIVTCNNQITGSEVCQSIAKSYWKNRHLLESDMSTGSITDALAWMSKDFSIIADSGDNPTAGGVGDRADILKEVLKQKINNTLFAGIASKSAYEALKDSNEFTLRGNLWRRRPITQT